MYILAVAGFPDRWVVMCIFLYGTDSLECGGQCERGQKAGGLQSLKPLENRRSIKHAGKPCGRCRRKEEEGPGSLARDLHASFAAAREPEGIHMRTEHALRRDRIDLGSHSTGKLRRFLLSPIALTF